MFLSFPEASTRDDFRIISHGAGIVKPYFNKIDFFSEIQNAGGKAAGRYGIHLSVSILDQAVAAVVSAVHHCEGAGIVLITESEETVLQQIHL